jgi:lysine biosynthesis protein LysW
MEIVTECLDCDAPIRLLKPPRIGMRVTCPACKAEFEVIEVDPLELDWPFDGEWSDEDEEGAESW